MEANTEINQGQAPAGQYWEYVEKALSEWRAAGDRIGVILRGQPDDVLTKLWRAYQDDERMAKVEGAINQQIQALKDVTEKTAAIEVFENVKVGCKWIVDRIVFHLAQAAGRPLVSPMARCLDGKACKSLRVEWENRPVCVKVLRPVFDLDACPAGRWRASMEIIEGFEIKSKLT